MTAPNDTVSSVPPVRNAASIDPAVLKGIRQASQSTHADFGYLLAQAAQELASRHGIVIIEDNAQSLGASLNGKKLGSFGACAATSFYPSKNLGAYGDAGMIFTDNEEIAERIAKLRNHGQTGRYLSAEPGWNSRLDDIQAAVLRVKARHLDRFTQPAPWVGRSSRASGAARSGGPRKSSESHSGAWLRRARVAWGGLSIKSGFVRSTVGRPRSSTPAGSRS